MIPELEVAGCVGTVNWGILLSVWRKTGDLQVVINIPNYCIKEVSQSFWKLQAKLVRMQNQNRRNLNENCAGIIKIKER